MSILKGDNSKMEFTGITFAGKGQNLDTGAKVVHTGKNTSSYINTKSISKDGGISTFRSSVIVNSKAENSKASVSCQSLMLDSISRSDTIPAMDIKTSKADVGHEAQIGSISGEAKVGDPTVAGATVTASVVEEGKDKKVIVYKYKRKTGYHKKNGHRQLFTKVKIEKINA